MVDIHVLANQIYSLNNTQLTPFCLPLPFACPVFTRTVTWILEKTNNIRFDWFPQVIMTLTSEQAIQKLGGFGWFQLRILLLPGYGSFFTTMTLMVMTFSSAEPPWRCTANSTSCTLNGTFKAGDTNYDHRCNIPRSDWEFAVDGHFDSIVTEVIKFESNVASSNSSLTI